MSNEELLDAMRKVYQDRKQEACPTCGHCPTCGRSNQPVYIPMPYYQPYPWYHRPYQDWNTVWCDTGITTTISTTGTSCNYYLNS